MELVVINQATAEAQCVFVCCMYVRCQAYPEAVSE